MKAFLKTFSSLIIALIILLGILFIPETNSSIVRRFLYKASSASATKAYFGNYMVQKIGFTLIIILITTLFIIESRTKEKEENKEI